MPVSTKALMQSAYDLEEAKSQLDRIARKLMAKKWFKDNWLVDVYYFPPRPANPESASMHVYKRNWYNESHKGIHFEAQFGPEQFAKNVIPVMLHIFHTDTIPDTKIKRIRVSKPFVDATYDTIAAWKGYSFRVGKYGTQPFTCKLEFTSDTFVDKLEAEFSRLCLELGDPLDRALEDALA